MNQTRKQAYSAQDAKFDSSEDQGLSNRSLSLC